MKAKLSKKAELRKRHGRYFLVLEDGILYNGDLSLKNCQAIERGYDLDELVKNHTLEVHNASDGFGIERGIVYGFQKAVELMSDKKFTEEDVIKFMQFIISQESLDNTSSVSVTTAKYYLDNFQSLQQNEWEVEIEMECTQCQSYGYISECRDNCNKKFLQPKLDADGCLILKRI